MEAVQVGDIIALDAIREHGYDMVEQVNVGLECFPVPMLVTKKNDTSGTFWVHWVHPESKRSFDWYFRYRHLAKAELIE